MAYHAVPALLTALAYVILVVPIARVTGARKRRAGGRPAILRAPIPIISIHYSAAADRIFGYRSDTLVYHVYQINDASDFDYVLTRASSLPLVGRLVPYGVFLWASFRYDIFGFFFDGGLLGYTPFWWVELPLLRLAGKRVFVYPYGGDARIASATRRIGRWHAFTDIQPGAEDRDEAMVARRVRALGRAANAVLGCADLVEDLPRLDGVVQYPVDAEAWRPVPPKARDTVLFVHSPNHRHYKGTRYLIEASERLRAEGVPIELRLVEGMTNVEARRVYEEADVIADQFLIGAYAMLAIEGMALGKPVICYLNERFAPYHPEWSDCPIVSASPDELEDALRRLATDAALREELGRRGPPYVRAMHSLESTGAELDRLYRRLWARAA